MDVLNQRLSLRKQQIADMKIQVQEINSERSAIGGKLNDLNLVIAQLEKKMREKDEELKKELEVKEKALGKLQDLEGLFERPKEDGSEGKKQEVANAYIEFYTRTVQSKPMFKKLPEIRASPEPYSPPVMNDVELDEELEKLGLSDVLKKYS
jgi:chromosome segregation ATPase